MLLRAFYFCVQVVATVNSALSQTKNIRFPFELISQLRAHGWSWKSAGAVGGLSLGLLCPALGSLVTLITWFIGPEWHGLHLRTDSTVLLFLTVPMLLFGAHCLDLLDRDKERKRDGENR